VTSKSASVLIEVNGTVESMLVVQQSGLPPNKSTVWRKKCLLLANVPMLIKTPNILEPSTLYKFSFTGFGSKSSLNPSVMVKTSPPKSKSKSKSSLTQPEPQTLVVVCNSTSLHSNSRATPNNMYSKMSGSSLIIRLDKHVVHEPNALLECLENLENEVSEQIK